MTPQVINAVAFFIAFAVTMSIVVASAALHVVWRARRPSMEHLLRAHRSQYI